jgi:acetate kinase
MILVLNAGSSSLKCKVYDDAFAEIAAGIVERIGLKMPSISFTVRGAKSERSLASVADHKVALSEIFSALVKAGVDTKAVHIVGHRVVHGGEEFVAPTVIDAKALTRLKRYTKLAPLHNPANLAGIAACRGALRKARNVAVFDTAFHATIPQHAYLYALPWKFYEKDRIRKYGFHGISHKYVSAEAAKRLGRPLAETKLVTCHLGSGCSVTAVKGGVSIDTSMGFTPLEGLTMSTRCGDLDPAVPLYLIRSLGYSTDEVDEILNKKSGLLGVSGYKDLRDVLAAAGIDKSKGAVVGAVTKETRRRANLAFEMFCYDIARYVGMYAAIMGGVDAVVFTAGIGERSEATRKRVMELVTLPWNPQVLVVPTDEEKMIAIDAVAAAGKAA